MFSFAEVSIENIIVHHIGNKVNMEGIKLSRSPLRIDDDTSSILQNYFLNHFNPELFYHFFHEENLNSNLIFNYCDNLFSSPKKFHEISVQIAQHLYDTSDHPKIKAGELYVVYFHNCIVDEELVEAVGIFKTENKDTFLKVIENEDGFNILWENGISIKKIDKGCLVFNTEKDNGFKVSIIDNINKSKEASFWRDDFLKLVARKDDYYQTQNYLDLCKGFVNEVFNDKNDVEKADQIDLLNKSINYFSENETFQEEAFAQNVMMGEQSVIDAFKEYKQHFENEKEIALNDTFGVAPGAVKSAKRKFKSILKLDSNFHIYIHGDRSRIVKGYDEAKGLNFYTLYFEGEE